jgi:hypothetical protein
MRRGKAQRLKVDPGHNVDCMAHSDFVHKIFKASEWELEVKTFIDKLHVQDSIWYKENKGLKKAAEELITLGYYVKYKFGMTDSIQFLSQSCSRC